jgi:hypothetical protein
LTKYSTRSWGTRLTLGQERDHCYGHHGRGGIAVAISTDIAVVNAYTGRVATAIRISDGSVTSGAAK